MFDGLKNVMQQLGCGGDPAIDDVHTYDYILNYTLLDRVYREGGLAANIVDMPVDDALRNWREFNSKDSSLIRAVEKDLLVQQQFGKLVKYSRLYGGAALLMITGQPLDEPLNIDAVGKGDLKNLIVFDKNEVFATDINFTNPLSSNYLRPDFFNLYQRDYKIHHSHFVIKHGIELPRRLMQSNNYWGDSVVRRVLENINNTLASRKGVAGLLRKANQDVITRQGLNDELRSAQDKSVIERYRLFKQMMSNLNLAVLDGTEDFSRHTINFSGIAQVMDELKTWIAADTRIPITKLFGTSAKGMNATGEGDEKNYFADIKADQDGDLRLAIEQLDRVMIRSALGYFPDDLEFEWNPLYQSDETEIAQQRLANSQSDSTYLEEKIIKRSHVMMRLQAKGEYKITDEEIEKQKEIENQEAELEESGEFDFETEEDEESSRVDQEVEED